MKGIKELVIAVTLMEGKKVEVTKSNVNEVLNCLAKICATDDTAHTVLWNYIASKTKKIKALSAKK